MTAEAREPKRRELLLEQLTLAGQFRNTMENTAKTANQEGSTVEQVTRSLSDQTSQMHQLTALTQAVQRQQVQESYDDYDKWAKDDRQLRDKKIEAAKAILRDQCERLADPKKERPSRIPIIEHAPPAEEPQVPVANVPEEAMKPAAVTLFPTPQQVCVDERGSLFGSKKSAPPTTTPPPPPVRTVAPPPSPPRRQALERPTEIFEGYKPQKKSRLSLPMTRPTKPEIESPPPRATATTTPNFTKTKSHKKKKPSQVAIPSPEAIRPDNTPSYSTPVSTASTSKKRKSSPPQRFLEPNYTAAANSPASIATDADARPDSIISGVLTTHAPRPRSRRQQRRDGPKKCHNCKTMQTEYLKCNYFLVTGHRCGKFYCSACLKDDYGEDVDLSVANDDWQYVLLFQQILRV